QATKNRLAAANRKLKEALYGLPTAAECGLSGPARGLLNRALDPAAAPMPTDTGGAAGTAAAPAADPGATEADIAGWAADAIALYGECRARIDAIRQWDEVTHGRWHPLRPHALAGLGVGHRRPAGRRGADGARLCQPAHARDRPAVRAPGIHGRRDPAHRRRAHRPARGTPAALHPARRPHPRHVGHHHQARPHPRTAA